MSARSSGKPITVLCIVPYPTEGPSNRLRVEQYRPYLEAQGFRVTIRPFVSSRCYRVLYEPGRYLLKTAYLLWGALKRLGDLVRGLSYDVILIHRESSPFGPPVLEWCWARAGKRLVFDFDDAIFLPYISHAHPWIGNLKPRRRVAQSISLARWVIAGNEYLAAYARQYNPQVVVIPTPVDTARYRPPEGVPGAERVVIGWIGSRSTIAYLERLRDVFARLGQAFPLVEVRVVGGPFAADGLPNVLARPWRLEREAEDLQGFDIGIMPMPDDPWTRGKCAFKAILCMSVGLPVVCSPVGVNLEVVQDGRNGFLASTDEEWFERLSRLITDSGLRERMGREARQTVEERYALARTAERLIDVLRKAAAS
jgi:glycosyltransferase involved in cell wall biosynthesis